MKRILQVQKICAALGGVLLMLTLILLFPSTAYADEGAEVEAVGDDIAVIASGENGYTAAVGGEVRCSASLSELIAITEADGRVLTFKDVNVNESISICKNVTLSGTLTVNGSVTFSSPRAVLDGISLTASGGNVDIKEGSVELVSGAIILSGRSAVRLDFSASALFSVKGGEILKSASGAAVLSSVGTVAVSGGRIENIYGTAIENHASLYLSGNASITGFSHGIFTSRPIHLSYRGSAYEGNVRVMYARDFEKGSFTTVFLDARDEAAEVAQLYDASGAELPLTFFADCPYTDEENIFAVYLPYRADFFVGGSLYATEFFLSGEAPAQPTAPTLFGYDFSAWSVGGVGKEEYTFLPGINADISLYASFTLSAPEFSLSSKSTVYNTEEQAFGFTSVFHPLADVGTFSFVWYKNSEIISESGRTLSLSETRDSGSYFCKLTFAYKGDYVTVTTPSVNFEILPASLEAPKIPNAVYNGSLQYPSLPASHLYTVDAIGAVNVGSYTVMLTLTDSENYVWQGGGSSVYVPFTILPAENSFISPLTVKDTFFGTAPQPRAVSGFGQVRYYYSRDGKSYTELPPSEVGEYFVIARVDGTENYTALTSEPLSFSILSELAVGLKIDAPPARTEYRAFDKLDLTGIRLTVTYNSGRSNTLGISDVTVKYSTGEYLLPSDSCVMLEYSGVGVPLPVTVSAAEYDLSGILFADTVCTFDGHRHTIAPSGEIVGLDGIPLEYEVKGGGINAGRYTVTLFFICRSPNYLRPEQISATLTVLPREITVVYSNTEFVYDGSMKLPTASYISAEGATVFPTLIGGGVAAGEYVARVDLNSENYVAKNPTVSFTVSRAVIDISGAVWSSPSLVYNGEEQRVFLTEIPHGLRVIGYTDAAFREVGTYTAVAAVAYDEKNYVLGGTLSHNWQITPAEYDMSGFYFADSEYVFDGSIHYPRPAAPLPIGRDGSSPTYTFDRGACHVSEGTVRVRISFETVSKNYLAPSDMYASVTVLPRSVKVSWGELTFVYDGGSHVPTATCDECAINVFGGGTDAGTYTATAVSESTDFTVTNGKVAFTVTKAQNSWLISPSVLSIYEGGTLTPRAESRFGEIKFKYFSDAEGSVEIPVPTECGTYYMAAYVPEGKNCYALKSDMYEFSIIKVVPLELHVRLNSDKLYAKEIISPDDFSSYLVNNDGSIRELISDDVEIVYKNGDSLSATDNYVTFTFGGISYKMPIRVLRADYDMSGVRWENNFHTYDGEEKSASLVGLPNGITLIRYIENSATEAGSYKLSALLDYDRENYNEPEIPEAWLVIKPSKVTLPKLADLIYNGTAQAPEIDASSLYTFEFSEGVHAGEYTVTFTLCDDKNYAFADGVSTLTYKILPIKLHLRPSALGRGYKVVSGSIIEGDSLGEEYYTEGGAVMMRITNTDYEITVEYVRSRSTVMWLLIILLLLLVGLGIYIFIRYRERILFAVGIGPHSESEGERETDPKEKEDPNGTAPSAAVPDTGENTASLNTLLYVDEAHADSLISDDMAKSLLSDTKERVPTKGRRKCIVNLDCICENFSAGDTVDINAMKDKGIIPRDGGTVKVLARGVMNKPLTVIANNFSLSAVKMIALTGGTAKRVRR